MMTKEVFLAEVAKLVAGLQVPVTMMPRAALGVAYEPWEKLSTEVTGGFGWTNAEDCEKAFRKILADD